MMMMMMCRICCRVPSDRGPAGLKLIPVCGEGAAD